MSISGTNLTKILVPLDGSDRAEAAVPAAMAVASKHAEIILLEVTPTANNVRNIFGQIIADAHQVQRGYDDLAEKNLSRAAGQVGSGARVEKLVVSGDPADQILKVADDRDVDLIAMTSQGRGAWGPAALGSIVDRVINAAGRPVLIVHPNARPITGLILASDGSEYAANAIPVTAKLATALDVPVRVLHALDPSFHLPPGIDVENPRAARYAEAGRIVDAAVTALENAGARASGEVLTGEPSSTVVSAARPGEAVVITSHGQTGTNRWPLGAVAGKLIRSGAVSVVLVPVGSR